MKKSWWYVIGSVAVFAIVSSIILILGSHGPIPPAIQKQLVSTAFVPSKATAIINTESFKYDSVEKLMSFTANYKGTLLTLSEQASPDIFADIPDAFTKFMNGLNNYQTFDSAQGKVYLTRPPKQDNKQTAIMNDKGTLLFVKADKDLTDDQWRKLFNNLQIAK